MESVKGTMFINLINRSIKSRFSLIRFHIYDGTENTNTRIQKVFLHITVLFHDLKFVNFGYPL